MSEKFIPFEPYPEERGYEPRLEEEREFERQIRACTDLDALIQLVGARGVIPSSDGTPRASSEVVRRIAQVRNGHYDIADKRITRTYGIRERVSELLSADRQYQKRMAEKAKREMRRSGK